MADNSPGDDFEFSNSTQDVSNGIGSCIEQAKAENIITFRDQMFRPRRGAQSISKDGSDARCLLSDMKRLYCR